MTKIGKPKGGRWFAYVAWQGWNRTGLGVAFYDDAGNLAGSKFSSPDEAIRRGDAPQWVKEHWNPSVPETLDGMDRRLETVSNAMSLLHWEGGLWTAVWSERDIESTFQYVIGQDRGQEIRPASIPEPIAVWANDDEGGEPEPSEYIDPQPVRVWQS